MPHLPAGTVTFLFTDVEGSTRMWEDDRAAMSAAVARLDATVAEHVEAHHGVVVKPRGEGDSHFCVFARASDAARAAIALQTGLADFPFSVRAAVHTGEAELRDADYYGPTVNRAARLRAIGHGGQILVSKASADLLRAELPAGAELRPLGVHGLKDLDDPEEVFQLEHQRERRDFPALKSLDQRRDNLPSERTSFVGREEQVVELVKLLQAERLVTLTGAGGSGKTRLALRVAGAAAERWPDGVWLVELAAIQDPDAVASAVAGALGLLGSGVTRDAPADAADARLRLVTRLKELSVLIVLDNAEHLVSAVADLADDLLAEVDGVSLLVTSREPLSVDGEFVFRVAPLVLPAATDESTTEAAMESEAVRLFVDRAGRARAGFVLDDATSPVVVDICTRLDGIPLAIELAAARMRGVSAARLRDRLDDILGVLGEAAGRGRTLEAAITWSHRLLDSAEQILFARLSVFAGSFSVAAAETVCAGRVISSDDVLDLLARLVDRSLLELAADGERYRMLEPIRQYAAVRLRESGEEDLVREAFVEWAVAEGEHLLAWGNDGLISAVKRVGDAEISNLRAAFVLARTGDGNRLLRLALGAFWYLTLTGHPEAREWIQEALARDDCDRATLRGEGYGLLTWANSGESEDLAEEMLPRVREVAAGLEPPTGWWWLEMALSAAGGHRYERHRDLVGARALLDEAAGHHRPSHPAMCQWMTSYCYAYLVAAEGRPEEAWEHADRGDAALPGEEGEMLAMGQFQRARIAIAMGDNERAHQTLLRALVGFRKIGNRQFLAWVLNHLAGTENELGHVDEALEHAEESVLLARRTGDWETVVEGLHTLGLVLRHRGDLAGARAALEEGYDLSLSRGGPEYPYTPRYLSDLAQLDAVAGDIARAARREAGAIPGFMAGNPGSVARAFRRIGYLAGRTGRHQAAGRLLGAYEAHRAVPNLPAEERPTHEAVIEEGATALGETAWKAAMDGGRTLTLEDAVSLATHVAAEIADSVDQAEA